MDLGSGGGVGAIFVVNFENPVAQKLRIIILLHLGLVIFNLHFPQIKKVVVIMIFGPRGVDVTMTPQTNYP